MGSGEIVENVGQTMYRDLTVMIFDLSGIFHMICYPLQIVNTPGTLVFLNKLFLTGLVLRQSMH